MKTVLKIILVALCYVLVSYILNKLLWHDNDALSKKELIRTGIIGLIVACVTTYTNSRLSRAKKQSIES